MRYATATAARLSSGAPTARKWSPTARSTSSTVPISTSGRCSTTTSLRASAAGIEPVTATSTVPPSSSSSRSTYRRAAASCL
jgi:hypothetical protein